MHNIEKNHHIFSHYEQDDSDQKTYNKCPHPNCFIDQVRNADGSLKLRNPHLQDAKSDFLYHLGFGTESDGLLEKFSDVKVSSCIFA